jgi:hypothetical protein
VDWFIEKITRITRGSFWPFGSAVCVAKPCKKWGAWAGRGAVPGGRGIDVLGVHPRDLY